MRRSILWTLLASFLGGIVGYAHWPSAVLPAGLRADRVIVEKQSRQLLLMRGDEVLKSYRVALGGSPAGPKARQGDKKTPEGRYVVDYRNPNSRFHLALHISYPSAADVARATQQGVDPGGAIMIHGLQNGLGWIGRWHRLVDWTDGCVAVTNPEIEEIWRAVPDGTPIEIRP